MLRAASLTTAAITGGTGVPIKLASWAVPVIGLSSGTMGNNGAITALTALPRTYSNGAWVFLPIGAIAAGVPAAAGYFWFVGSSTTAGTVFNSTYSGTGAPTIGTQTAFATTGPGAFTGDTTETGVLITVPANTLGLAGELRVYGSYQNNNTAGTKQYRTRYSGTSGTQFFATSQSTTTFSQTETRIWNTGQTNAQYGHGLVTVSSAALGVTTPTTASVDTTASTTVFISGQRNTATDNIVLEAGEVLFLA